MNLPRKPILLLILFFLINLASNGFGSDLTQQPQRTADTAFREGKELYRQGTAESLRKSIEKLEEAFQLWVAENDKHGQALALNDIGLSFAELGDYQKALEYYDRALPLWRFEKDQYNEATTLTCIANAYRNLGQYRVALDLLINKALPMRRATFNPEGEAYTLNVIGVTYSDVGDYQRALSFYLQSLPLFREFQDKIGQGSTYQNIGFAYLRLEKYKEALDFFQRGLTIYKTVTYPRGVAHVLNNLGRLYRSQNKYDESLAQYQLALSYSKTAGDIRIEAIIRNNIGTLYQDTGRPLLGNEHLYQALLVSRSQKYREIEGRTLGGLMSMFRLANNPDLAIFYGKQAINTYQEIRSTLEVDNALQKAFLKSREDIYRELADLLISLERLPEAQQVLDLLKDEEYAEYLRQARRRPDQKQASLTRKEADWQQRYRQISDKLVTIGRERAELVAKPNRTAIDNERLTALEADIAVGNRAFKEFLEQLPREFTADNLRPDTTAIRDFKALQSTLRELGDGTIALYTIILKDKYRVIVITPDVAIARRYDIPALQLKRKILLFREALRDRHSDVLPLAQEMYQIMVGPVAGDLKAGKAQTLMWVLDGLLRYVPVAALHDGRKYLVESYRNVVFTPASRDRIKDPVSKKWRGIGFGVSLPHPPDFDGLPAVPDELRTIIHDTSDPRSAAGLMSGTIKLDDGFTEKTMKELLRQSAELPSYQLVHIASHFKFEPGNETMSLLLLGDGKTISLDEIETSITLEGVELLTLSACNTAIGGNANGKEVEGFAVTAQRLGAKAVIATLWSVADQGTSHVMQSFYRLRAGDRNVTVKAEALRQAQVASLKGTNFNHPYYWAPFILIGNWK